MCIKDDGDGGFEENIEVIVTAVEEEAVEELVLPLRYAN